MRCFNTVVFFLFLLAYSPNAYSGSTGNGASQRNGQSATPAQGQNATASPGGVGDQGALVIHADPVAAAAEDQSPQRIVVSPDGHHVAFVSIRGSRFAVVVDGKPSPKYDEIGHTNNAVDRAIVFSNDGQHVMYIARRGDDQMAVVDGQELVGYALVDQFSFSPDGKQNAFVGRHDLQNGTPVMVVLNGKEGPAYFSIDGLQFSSNNAHIAYTSTVKDSTKPANTSVVIDGKNEKQFYHVHDFHFSADGNHWAYVGEDFTGNVPAGTSVQAAHLMADGKDLGAFENIYTCQISADGHVAYTANKGTHKDAQSEMIADDCAGLDAQVWDVAKGHRFPAHGASPPYLSPDGQHVAWLEERPGNNELCVAVNGKRGLGYKTINNIVFSLDSQHINYVAQQTGNGIYVVRDDDEAGPYQRTSNGMSMAFTIYLSPNGKHLAYQAGDGKMTFVVEDGKPQTSYEEIDGPLVFSPDGEHLAYVAKAKDPTANMTPIQRQQAEQSPSHSRGMYVVLDGQQQPVLPSVKFGSSFYHYGPHFSPDSKHLAYIGDMSTVVIDGQLVKKDPNRQSLSDQLDESFGFTADSKHTLWLDAAYHYVIDGDVAAGYTHAGNMGTNMGVPNYQPVLQPDGSIFFFATKDGDRGTVTGSGPHAVMISSALYRVTVNPGPARDFGTTSAAPANIAASSTTTPPSQTNAQQTTTTPPNPPAQTTSPPPTQSDAQTAANKAVDDAQKAKNTGNRLRGLFGH